MKTITDTNEPTDQAPARTQPAPNINKTRQLTICYKSFARQHGCANFPCILLSGKWVEDCGFQAGHVIDITCRHRRLTITIAKRQRFEGL